MKPVPLLQLSGFGRTVWLPLCKIAIMVLSQCVLLPATRPQPPIDESLPHTARNGRFLLACAATTRLRWHRLGRERSSGRQS
eukprot:766297-Hanusia_phi.AAC.3